MRELLYILPDVYIYKREGEKSPEKITRLQKKKGGIT